MIRTASLAALVLLLSSCAHMHGTGPSDPRPTRVSVNEQGDVLVNQDPIHVYSSGARIVWYVNPFGAYRFTVAKGIDILGEARVEFDCKVLEDGRAYQCTTQKRKTGPIKYQITLERDGKMFSVDPFIVQH